MQTTRPIAPQQSADPRPAESRPPLPSAFPPRRRFRLGTLVFVVLGCGLLAATVVGTNWLTRGEAQDNHQPPVANPGHVAAYGNVDVLSRVVNLHPSQPGEIVAVHVKEGDEVKKDQVLLKVDDRQAHYQVKAAEAAVADAKAKLEQARQMPELHEAQVRGQEAAVEGMRAESRRAEALRQRAERLYKSSPPLISKEEFDAATETVKKAEEGIKGEDQKLKAMRLKAPQLKLDIERAESEVKAKEALLNQAKHAEKQCELRAPADGSILRLMVSVGDLIVPNPVESAITFCPRERRIIRAEIQQEDAGRVRVGESALIQDDSRLTAEWRGKVKRLSDWYSNRRSKVFEPRQFNDVRTLECIIELDDPKDLRIGQRVRVILGK